MCGIAGIVARDGRPVETAVLQRMGDAIAHRGPDAEGTFVDEPRGVGLVNRRLAVIDIAGGSQPMTIESGETIVYNGEIFNAPEVRRDLESAGQRFRTDCDTEVVLRGYAVWGPDVANRLNGMWAFAIWDPRVGHVFLCRDRLGVKPLVYAETDAGLVFGSEIKALMASGLVPRTFDPDALPHYLSSFAVPDPLTFVRGVRRLPAGHGLIVAPAQPPRESAYWDCATAEEPDRGATAYADEVEELLEDSVRRRLVSDVPLGVLLSGGIDSRLVATFASRHVSSPIRTFTLGFGAGAADERAAARAVAAALGAEHHEDEVTAAQAAHELPALFEAYDEPGQSLVQTHLVSQFARREVTVALSGLGGDELFAAYPTHVVVNLLARFDELPAVVRHGLVRAAALAPSGRLRRVAKLARMRSDDRVSRHLIHQTPESLRADLLSADMRDIVDLRAPARRFEELYARAQSSHPLNRLLYVYIKSYLSDELLRASDAMSMWNSLELRTPFLDYRLVERAMAMSPEHKLRARTGKLVLREVAARTLHETASTVKVGFSPPVATWLRGELAEQVADALSPRSVMDRGVFDPVAAQKLLRGAMDGDDRLVPPAMMLYAFETWARRWLDHRPDEAPASAPVASFSGEEPELSIVIVNWNTRDILRDCLASIRRHMDGVSYETLVVDNASSDGSADMVATEFPEVRLLRNETNTGFGRANNQAMRAARGRWFLLLNSDTELLDSSVPELLQRVKQLPDLGAAHCKMLLPDDRVQHSTGRFASLRLSLLEDLGLYKLLPRERRADVLLNGYWDHEDERDVDWISGAFMLLPREVFEKTGGFDERLFMYGEDVEWCQRIRANGWRIRHFPQAVIRHRDHASADIRYGEKRIALCLERQSDLYVEQHGQAAGAAFMATRLIGTGLRAAYYALRARAPGEGGRRYASMAPYLATSFRMLLALAVRRR
jgi:asparagine synthase (glutamine-hydrolysing)